MFPLAKPRYRLAAGERNSPAAPAASAASASSSTPELLGNPLPSPESYRRLLAEPAKTLAELGRHDTFYKTRPHASPWDRSATLRLLKLAATGLHPARRSACYDDEEALSLTARLIGLFYETVLRDGAEPVILMFPTRDEATGWRDQHRKGYLPLRELLERQGYRVVDAMDVFDGAGRGHSIDELVPAHLSPLANGLVAELLHARLQGFGVIPAAAK